MASTSWLSLLPALTEAFLVAQMSYLVFLLGSAAVDFSAFLCFGPSSQYILWRNSYIILIFVENVLNTEHYLCVQLHLLCTFPSEDDVNWRWLGQHGWGDISLPPLLLFRRVSFGSRAAQLPFREDLVLHHFFLLWSSLASTSWPNLRGRRAANGEKQLPPKK